jgi:hypothetical protein
MAKEAANNYLSSMCVRNAILSAWTTLEMACCDALEIEKLENFKESLHAEFDERNITRLNTDSRRLVEKVGIKFIVRKSNAK